MLTSTNKIHLILWFISSLHHSGSNSWNCVQLSERYLGGFLVDLLLFVLCILISHSVHPLFLLGVLSLLPKKGGGGAWQDLNF